MIINILLGCMIYLFLGYITFRVWLKLAPPKYGRFSNNFFGSSTISQTWYLPNIIVSRKRNFGPTADRAWRTQGTGINTALVVSLMAWPHLILINTVVFLGKHIKTLNNCICSMLIPNLSSLQSLEEPLTESDDLLLKEFERLERDSKDDF